MMTPAALLKNTNGSIMVHATLDYIARERASLQKRFDDAWDNEIPRRYALVKALLDDTGDKLLKRWGRRTGAVLAKHTEAGKLLTKADPRDLIEARQIVVEMKREHGIAACPALATALELLAKLRARAEYLEKSAALDRLERRSDIRFAVQPAPVTSSPRWH
jgi:hypothetical protein